MIDHLTIDISLFVVVINERKRGGEQESAQGGRSLGQGTRLSDVAYRGIFEILYDRKLAAGAFVSQAHLVELTGVPVGPLRDALKALEAEGVLTIHPHTGIQFIKPGMELTRSTYQFRGIIEAAAVAIYAETSRKAKSKRSRRGIEAESDLERDGLTPENLPKSKNSRRSCTGPSWRASTIR